MDLVTEEINKALALLNIQSEKFSLLSDNEGEIIINDLLKSFVTGANRKWWWEAFSHPQYSIVFSDGKGFEKIKNFVPNSNEMVWFVVEEDQLPLYPIYEACASDIQKVIGECYGFEYYIVSKTKNWLLCENHHSRMIGVGDEVIQNMKSCSA